MKRILRIILLVFIVMVDIEIKAMTDEIYINNFNGVLVTTLENETINETVATLKSIKIDKELIKGFDPNVFVYDITYPSNTKKVNIVVEAYDKDAYIYGDKGNRSLKYGLNTFKIYVRGDNNEKTEYTLNITRIDDRSTINNLKTLSLSEGELKFDPKITEYEVKVDETVETITINSTLEDEKSYYVKGYGNREVKIKKGLNKILIKVCSEFGEEKVYTIRVIRGEYSYENATNVNITEIKIDGYKLNYSNDITEYKLKIKDEKKLEIDVKLEYEGATYQVLDNWNLSTGSVVTIKVISEDESVVKKVKIIIEQEKVDSVTLREAQTIKDTIVSTICFLVFLAGMILFFKALKQYNRKNNK